MPTISTADFRNGLTIEMDGEVYTILEFQHVKPGKGGAFVRSRLRNVRTGNVFEKTWRAGEKLESAHLEKSKMQYLYNTGSEYVFMDLDTYDQHTLDEEDLGKAVRYLKEGTEVEVVSYKERLIGVELPFTVALKVVQTEPGIRGDTAQGGSKPATLETGAVVTVPLFVNEGDTIEVDTRTDTYLRRV